MYAGTVGNYFYFNFQMLGFIFSFSISQIKKHSSSVARKKNVMYYTANDTLTNIAQKKYCWLYDDMPFLRETKVRVILVTLTFVCSTRYVFRKNTIC